MHKPKEIALKSLFFFRYPNPFLQQPPPSPLETQLKSQLPGGLGHDPRLWHREDVSVFLRYCEREFDLEQIDLEKFQMNGNFSPFNTLSCRCNSFSWNDF